MRSVVRSGRIFIKVVICAILVSPVRVETAPGAEKPGPPAELVLAASTENSVTLAWKPCAGGPAASGYRVYEYGVAVSATEGTSCTVAGLRPGTRYAFWVRAVDAAGNLSAPSARLTVTTPGAPPAAPPEPPAKMVVAYYASWRAYQGFTPSCLDGGKLSAINYAFADIGKDLRLIVSDPAVDPGNFSELAELKKAHPHLLAFISVGGWDGSARFSNVALTENSRAAFAASCLEFMTKYGFDGLDIDWEYPAAGGRAGNIRRPEDKSNFTLLLAKLRAELDRQGLKDNRRYYLTIAGAATPSYVGNYTEMGQIHKSLDWINVMTYDLHGKWNQYTDFQAALLPNSDRTGQDKLSTAGSLGYYLAAGVPPAKLVMGVPFYGHIYTGVGPENNGLYQRFKTCGTLPAIEAETVYLPRAGFARHWHEESMAPWLFGESVFIDYDNAESMEKKANYVRDRGFGGVMIWEIGLDPNQVLLDAILKGLIAQSQIGGLSDETAGSQ